MIAWRGGKGRPPGTDPEFFVGGGANPPEGQGRCQYTNSPNFLKNCIKLAKSVADPGFPWGGGANSTGGVPTYDFAKFFPKLHEIERIWTLGEAPPLRSATENCVCIRGMYWGTPFRSPLPHQPSLFIFIKFLVITGLLPSPLQGASEMYAPLPTVKYI